MLWGWHPGGDRAPVSVPHDVFVARFKQWAAAGGPCPSEVGPAAELASRARNFAPSNASVRAPLARALHCHFSVRLDEALQDVVSLHRAQHRRRRKDSRLPAKGPHLRGTLALMGNPGGVGIGQRGLLDVPPGARLFGDGDDIALRARQIVVRVTQVGCRAEAAEPEGICGRAERGRLPMQARGVAPPGLLRQEDRRVVKAARLHDHARRDRGQPVLGRGRGGQPSVATRAAGTQSPSFSVEGMGTSPV